MGEDQCQLDDSPTAAATQAAYALACSSESLIFEICSNVNPPAVAGVPLARVLAAAAPAAMASAGLSPSVFSFASGVAFACGAPAVLPQPRSCASRYSRCGIFPSAVRTRWD